MHNPNHSPFTRDIYPGLDEVLDAACADLSPDLAKIPHDGLGEAVNATVVGTEVTEEKLVWSHRLLSDSFARLRSRGIPGMRETLFDIYNHQPVLFEKITKLHDAWQRLHDSNEPIYTPEGDKITDTMKLYIMPWQDIRDTVFSSKKMSLGSWLVERLQLPSSVKAKDVIDMGFVQERLGESDFPIYRHPKEHDTSLSGVEYLDYKIANDGPFGLLLAQPFGNVGMDGIGGTHSGDFLTFTRDMRLGSDGIAIDAMGVFEWLALMLQSDMDTVDEVRQHVLLANRFLLDNQEHGMYARLLPNSKVMISKYGGNQRLQADWRPHLAVQ